VKTRHLAEIHGAPSSFDRLINSELGRKYLGRARAAEAAARQAAHEAATRPPTPHVTVVRRKIADALAAQLANDPTPCISKFDAAQLATKMARENGRDFGLRRAALTLHRIWTIDKEGSLSIRDLAELRRRAAADAPKSLAGVLFDEVLPQASYHRLPIKRLAALASTITTQADYDRVIRMNGLDGSDPIARRSRAYILAQVNRQAQYSDEELGVAGEDPSDTMVAPESSGDACEWCEKPADSLQERWVPLPHPGGSTKRLCQSCSESLEAANFKRSRQAGDDGNAGEQAWHPDVPEDGQIGEDAVHVEAQRGLPSASDRSARRQAKRHYCEQCGADVTDEECPHWDYEGKKADKPSEPEFKPAPIVQQHEATDQEGVALPDADMTKLSRDQRRARLKAALKKVRRAMTAEQVRALKANLFDWMTRTADDSADEELAEDVEDVVNEHMTENAPEELSEGHKPWAKKMSRARIEAAILDGRTVKVAGYAIRLASRKGHDQVEMTARGEPPMAWPLRRMTAAIDYYAKVVEGQADEGHTCDSCALVGQETPATESREVGPGDYQMSSGGTAWLCDECVAEHDKSASRHGQFDPSVNQQQDDAVKPPAAKHPLDEESSAKDVDSLEPSSILDSHPAQDQAGTSEPSDDMSGVNDEEGFADPSVKPHHPTTDQSGVSLPATDLGPHSSGDEPAAFEVDVSPGRSAARVDRSALREAMRGTFRHVRPTDPENV